jgi:hypothetical protein
MRVGRLYYKPGEGFRYLTVWISTPGNPRRSAVRGPFSTVEACGADLRAIS